MINKMWMQCEENGVGDDAAGEKEDGYSTPLKDIYRIDKRKTDD